MGFMLASTDLDRANVVVGDDVLSLAGMCLMRTGWCEHDQNLLNQSCLVIRPERLLEFSRSEELSPPAALRTEEQVSGRKPVEIGTINKNNQMLVRRTNDPGNHHNNKIWILRRLEPVCGLKYGANGCDFHARRCPNHGGRPPSLPSGA
jgi:hypothetical protein